LLILYSLSVIAIDVCKPEINLWDRLRDDCSIEGNGICEDGEDPLKDEDCKLNADALGCKGSRCIFMEIWAAKLIIFILVYLLLIKKRGNFLVILLLVAILFFNFANTPEADNIKSAIEETVPIAQPITNEPKYTEEQIGNNTILKIGNTIMPSNPEFGFLILAGTGGFFIYAGYQKRKKSTKRRRR